MLNGSRVMCLCLYEFTYYIYICNLYFNITIVWLEYLRVFSLVYSSYVYAYVAGSVDMYYWEVT
jgi:hypothetical protein